MSNIANNIAGFVTIEDAIIDGWIADGWVDAFEWCGYKLFATTDANNFKCCGEVTLNVRMSELTEHNLKSILEYHHKDGTVDYHVSQAIAALPLGHESLDYAYMRDYTLKNLPDKVENADYPGQYYFVRRTVYEPILPELIVA